MQVTEIIDHPERHAPFLEPSLMKFDRVSDRKLMKKHLLILPLLCLTFTAFAQNTGHPGGGGPDVTVKDLDVACLTLSGLSESAEKEFVKSWGRKYKSSKNFFKLTSEIIAESMIHNVDLINELKDIDHPNCRKNIEDLVNLSFAKRPHYKEELIQLRDIAAAWEKGKKNIPGSKRCSGEFTDRAKHLDDLKTLIELYEKSSP